LRFAISTGEKSRVPLGMLGFCDAMICIVINQVAKIKKMADWSRVRGV